MPGKMKVKIRRIRIEIFVATFAVLLQETSELHFMNRLEKSAIFEPIRDVKCSSTEFRCQDGMCIPNYGCCNGVIDCSDGSDETQALCGSVSYSYFTCDNGEKIPSYLLCDGIPHCSDGSDQSVYRCPLKCPSSMYQCADGTCVTEADGCNDICATGSAESSGEIPEVCRKKKYNTTPSWSLNKCILPEYPPNGSYSVLGVYPAPDPGFGLNTVYLMFKCHNASYKLSGPSFIYCMNGNWSEKKFPVCLRTCRLPKHKSIKYQCLLPEDKGFEGIRQCEEHEAHGTFVKPQCKPGYYSPMEFLNMLCIDGAWNYQPMCLPECGTLSPSSEPLMLGGRVARWGQLPWHLGVYERHNGHEYKCGATLITLSVGVGAAHCFSSETSGPLPADQFAVAAGKVDNRWDHTSDHLFVQKSNVKRISIPKKFSGVQSNYKHDFAIFELSSPMKYTPYVHPACVDLSDHQANQFLRSGNLGMVGGWGLIDEHNWMPARKLRVMHMPVVPYAECRARMKITNIEFPADDKFCAGYGNGSALCKGDSGGGLVFPVQVRGVTRYHLQGVVSASPPTDKQCDGRALTSFTDVRRHAQLIDAYRLQ